MTLVFGRIGVYVGGYLQNRLNFPPISRNVAILVELMYTQFK